MEQESRRRFGPEEDSRRCQGAQRANIVDSLATNVDLVLRVGKTRHSGLETVAAPRLWGRHRSAYVKNVSGTPWPGLEEILGGQSGHRCLLCEQDGDEHHLVYQCERLAEQRAQQTSAALRQAARNVADQPAARRALARGTLPKGTALVPDAKAGQDAAFSMLNKPAASIM